MTSYEAPTSTITPRASVFMDSQGSGGMRTHFPSERKWALGLQVCYLVIFVDFFFLLFCLVFDKCMHIGTLALNLVAEKKEV